MTIWQLRFPAQEVDFAMAVGLDQSRIEGPTCRKCKRTRYDRKQPLVMKWDPGSSNVGDFTWVNVTTPVITERVCNALRSKFKGFDGGPVEMVQDPKVKRPLRVTKRTNPRVWLPYEGPKLFELWRTTWVHMDRGRTTARLTHRCDACGDERWELTGTELLEHRVEVIRPSPHYEVRDYYVREPRQPGQGLYVRATDLAGADIFGVHEFFGWTFCTDRVREFIQQQGYTNVEFLEMGEVV